MARELRYQITGDARDFTRAMQSVDRRLASSERSAKRFGAGFGAAMRGLGGAATAAGAAIGAGLVLETKRSIEAFQESQKVSRQTQAVLKSTGGAANVTAREISRLSQAISRRTGVDDEAVASAQNLLATFTNVRNEAGRGNKVFSQATRIVTDMSVALGQDMKSSSIQVGKALNDPIKGITALSRVGVSFTEQQKKQITALTESGKRVDAQRLILAELRKEFGGSAAAQANWSDKLRVAFGNLEEDIGSGLAPAFNQVAKRATHFARDVEPEVIRAAKRIGQAFGRKDLSLEQQFRLSASEARGVFEPLVEQARAAIGRADLGERLNEGIAIAVPKIADTLAAHAPKAAESFVKAFVGAGIWGRVLIGGFLLKKMGGLGAFRSLGAQQGAAAAAGYRASFAVGTATAGAGGGRGAAAGAAAGAATGRFGKVALGARGLVAGGAAALGGPIGIGVAATAILGPEIIKKVVGDAKSMGQAVEETTNRAQRVARGNTILFIRDLRRQADAARKAGTDIDRDYGDKLAQVADRTEREWRRSVERTLGVQHASAKDIQTTNVAVGSSWDRLARDTDARMDDIRRSVRGNTLLVKRDLGRNTEEGRRALASNFREAADAVRDQMRRGAVSTREGTEQIKGYLVQALRSLGLSSTQASAKVDNGTLQPTSGRVPGQAGDRGRAGGGWIGRRGQRGADTVPIVVGAGEAVLNRHQQAVVEGLLGNGFLDRLFAKVQTPHYMATGGYVPQPQMAQRFAGGGKIPRVTVNVSGAPGAAAQRAVDIDRNAALDIYRRKASQIGPGGGPMGSPGGGGTGIFDGRAVANWIIPILNWARGHGWGGHITSGYRSFAEQAAIKARDPRAAAPGTSNHNFTAYPGGAIDVGGFEDRVNGQALASVLAGYRGPRRLVWGGPVINDWGHFSANGHARGGRPRRFAVGGRVGPTEAAALLWKHGLHNVAAATHLGAITARESGGNPNAKNLKPPDHSIGLWQINQLAHKGRFGSDAQLTNPDTNAKAAVALYREAGLAPWHGMVDVPASAVEAAARAFDGGRLKPYWARQVSGGTGGDATEYDGPTRLDRLQAKADLAALTPGGRDDRRAARAIVRLYKRRLRRARKHDRPRSISEAAQGLAGAQETLAGLQPDRLGGRLERLENQRARLDQGDTDFANRLTIKGIDPDSPEGLQAQLGHEARNALTLQAQKRGLQIRLKNALKRGDKKAAKRIRAALRALNSAILAERARIAGIQGSMGDAATVDTSSDNDAADAAAAAAEEAAAAQRELTATIAALTAQMAASDRVKLQLAASSNGVVADWVGEAVSTKVAVGAALAGQTPGVPGRYARNPY